MPPARFTIVLMCSNWASRSGCCRPPGSCGWLAGCTLLLSSSPTTVWLTCAPRSQFRGQPAQALAGPPQRRHRVAARVGSTSASRSASSVGSCTSFLRPPARTPDPTGRQPAPPPTSVIPGRSCWPLCRSPAIPQRYHHIRQRAPRRRRTIGARARRDAATRQRSGLGWACCQPSRHPSRRLWVPSLTLPLLGSTKFNYFLTSA